MKKYVRVLIILLLSLLLIFALLRLGNVDVSLDTLARVSWGWLLAAFAVFYTSLAARGMRWRRILNTMGWPVSFVYAQTLLIAGLFISAILPARLGDVGRIVMLKQDHKIPVAQGIASITTERALDVFSILILAALGSIWAVQGRVPAEVSQLLMGTTILFVAGLVGLLVIPGIEHWLRELNWLRAIVPDNVWRLYQKVLDFGFSLIHGVRALGKKPLVLTLTVVESLCIWLADTLILYFAFISIGVQIPFSVSVFSMMISDLVAAIPLTPAALGQFDAAMAGSLSLFGLTLADISLAIILIRFVSFWTFVPVSGLITYIFGFSHALSLKRTDTEIAAGQPALSSNPAES